MFHSMTKIKSSCCTPKRDCESKRVDPFFWGPVAIVLMAYVLSFFPQLSSVDAINLGGHHIRFLMNEMIWGIVIGICFVSLLSFIPQEAVLKVLGVKPGKGSILRATLAGVFLDLCSHGILMVAVKFYRQGAHLSQVIAFLVASPWNSLSLTVILIALIGWQWTLTFIVLSMVVAVITGLVFQKLEDTGFLPKNPNTIGKNIDSVSFKELFAQTTLSRKSAASALKSGLHESRIIIKWLFIGVIIAAAIKVFIPVEQFKTYFGPDLLGMSASMVFATILEVCSEGLAPVASDILTTALAPGNAFLFLMAGVATDYTEIMVLKETTKSWRIALTVPAVVVPQVLILAYFLNI